jgi:hypothetical protein
MRQRLRADGPAGSAAGREVEDGSAVTDQKPAAAGTLRGAGRLGAPPPRRHPAVDTLAAYGRRELAARRRPPLQDHLSRCRDCALLVLDFAGFETLAPPAPTHRVSAGELRRRRRALARRIDAARARRPSPRV